jgi:hypothetical protein
LPALREGTIEIRLFGLTAIIVVLGLIYGVCMGCFALLRYNDLQPADLYMLTVGAYEIAVPAQLVASMVKVPALFLLTLLVTFPSLYVFNALVGSRLSVGAVWKLLIAALGVNLAVLASLGPVVAFFSVCTTSYPFMVLLNVVVFAAAGLLGLVFLLQTLHRLTIAQAKPAPPPVPKREPVSAAEHGQDDSPESGAPEDDTQETQEKPAMAEVVAAPAEAGALDQVEGYVLGRHVRNVFRVWVVIFALVGAQMGWVLRPFIGAPSLPFSWFRQRESNFFEAVIEAIRQLVIG